MEENQWLKELTEMAKYDPEYQQYLAQARLLEPEFLSIRDSLPENRRALLDTYLAACEQMDHFLLCLAWSVAWDRGADAYIEGRKRHAAVMQDVREHSPLYQAASKHPEPMAWELEMLQKDKA